MINIENISFLEEFTETIQIKHIILTKISLILKNHFVVKHQSVLNYLSVINFIINKISKSNPYPKISIKNYKKTLIQKNTVKIFIYFLEEKLFTY